MKQLLKFSLFLLLTVSLAHCSKDSLDDEPMQQDPMDEEPNDDTLVSFSKAANTDPSQEANQDRITDNVWITRANDGGQIFNIKTEVAPEKTASPADTRWAIGSAADKDNLTFAPFREAVGKPQNVVGKSLVLHLVTDDIYIDVKFTSWASEKTGSFAYERTKL